MRTTRFLLMLSPLVVLLPRVGIELLRGTGGGVAVILYSWRAIYFPWDLILAGVVYLYARHHRGGEAFWWAAGTAFAPYLVPLGLVFMPASKDSTAAVMRRTESKPVVAARAPIEGPIEERLPLLDRCLAGAPEKIRAEQKSRFERVAGNMEFSLWADRGAAERIAGEATGKDFTVWVNAGEAATHVYGLGEIHPERHDAVLEWLKRASGPGRALTVALREADGHMGMSEYGSARAAGA